jgi:hypothetical protein
MSASYFFMAPMCSALDSSYFSRYGFLSSSDMAIHFSESILFTSMIGIPSSFILALASREKWAYEVTGRFGFWGSLGVGLFAKTGARGACAFCGCRSKSFTPQPSRS